MAPYDVRSRTIGYYRDDLSGQLEERLSDVGCDCEQMPKELTARRVRFADVNHDGHSDLLFDEVTYDTTGDCGEDEIGWPHLDHEPDAPECAGEIQHSRWLYDAASDSWPDPRPTEDSN
jgi:hypothetical protein